MRGREEKYPHHVTIRLDDELNTYINTLAAELGTTRSAAIRLMLKFAAMLDPEKVKKKMKELKL